MFQNKALQMPKFGFFEGDRYSDTFFGYKREFGGISTNVLTTGRHSWYVKKANGPGFALDPDHSTTSQPNQEVTNG